MQVPRSIFLFVLLTGVAAAQAGLDHFRCYTLLGPAVILPDAVALVDQFRTPQTPIVFAGLGRARFCNPVAKNHNHQESPILNVNNHLTWYKYIQTPAEPVRQVLVTNQFGQQQPLTVNQAEFLAVPTRKNAQPAPANLDHFNCYAATGPQINDNVGLRDQFKGDRVRVLRPAYLCNPVHKLHNDVVTEIGNPNAHLVCYTISLKKIATQALIRNQMEAAQLAIGPTNLLCTPSSKQLQPDVD
ncbi:MAG: DUF7450 family protein [Gammaproteobacteria bacterium]